MKLYGTSLSPYAGRVLLVLRAKGSDLSLLPPPLSGPERDAFLAINPQGKIPFLDDAGFHLPESAVIADYLDAVLPGPPLWPDGQLARARAALLARLVDVSIAPGATGYMRALLSGSPDPRVVDETWATFAAGLEALAHYRDPSGAWLNGDGFGHGDAALLPLLFSMTLFSEPTATVTALACFPDLVAYWERARQVPFVAAVFAEAEARAAFVFGEGGPLHHGVAHLKAAVADGRAAPSAATAARFPWFERG